MNKQEPLFGMSMPEKYRAAQIELNAELREAVDQGNGRIMGAGSLNVPYVQCPKHGEHQHTIGSSVPGHEGMWCQICWLESLGQPLPVVMKPFVWSEEK